MLLMLRVIVTEPCHWHGTLPVVQVRITDQVLTRPLPALSSSKGQSVIILRINASGEVLPFAT